MPQIGAVAEHVVERGEERARDRGVARGRVGDERPDDDALGRREHLRVDDVGLLPEDVRVERPRVREAQPLGALGQLDDAAGGRIGLEGDAEVHGRPPTRALCA